MCTGELLSSCRGGRRCLETNDLAGDRSGGDGEDAVRGARLGARVRGRAGIEEEDAAAPLAKGDVRVTEDDAIDAGKGLQRSVLRAPGPAVPVDQADPHALDLDRPLG